MTMRLSAILSSTREEIGLTNEGEGMETTKNTYLDVFVVFFKLQAKSLD